MTLTGMALRLNFTGLALHGIGASRHPAVQSEKTLWFNPIGEYIRIGFKPQPWRP